MAASPLETPHLVREYGDVLDLKGGAGVLGVRQLVCSTRYDYTLEMDRLTRHSGYSGVAWVMTVFTFTKRLRGRRSENTGNGAGSASRNRGNEL